MTFSRFKNILIVFLAFIALYQTSAIWFGDTGSNLLTFFARGRQQEVGSELRRNFAFPMRVIAGDGSHYFRVIYSGMSTNTLVDFCDAIMVAALQRDDMPRTSPPDFRVLLEGNVLIYEYPFEMPSREFVQALGLQPGTLSIAIDRFNQIIFSAEPYGVNIYFHNRNTGAWAGYFVSDTDISERFKAVTEAAVQEPNQTLLWASSTLLGFNDNPYSNLFIPVWEETGHRYLIGEARPAHFDSTVGAVMSVIRENVLSFFDNPAAIYNVPTVGGFAWADESTIVRHFGNNVLRYTSYRRDLRGSEFLDDFARALDFIASRDLLMTNDFYLSGFREHNNERVFYFEYLLDGLPVIFTDVLRYSISEHTSSAITVRFRDGNLVEYTRLAYELRINPRSSDNANRDLPLYILNSGLDIEGLESITLGFAAPRIDLAGAGSMNLWVNFRMQDGISSMESLGSTLD